MELFTTFCTYRSHADFFFFCGSINLNMISTVKCLLQTQIHGKKYTCTGKNQMENTKLHDNQNH